MGTSWPKVIRNPVHSLIAFHDTEWDRLLLQLLNCKEVQRLRRIKQLGFSELVFPGANHNRFAHSVGVLHVAKKFLDQFDRLSGTSLKSEQKTFVLAACLLHDVGHGPFSHAFEKVTGQNHEAFTGLIIRDPSTEVNAVLRAFDPEMPQRLADFFYIDPSAPSPMPYDLPDYLGHVVSSQLDSDRCDYLLRDSHATGTGYGRFDLEWLVNHLQPGERRFHLSAKALAAVEAYLYARAHMYRTVYFHKTSRAAEVMLGHMFRRVKELLKGSAEFSDSIAADTPCGLARAFTGQMSLSDYLSLDDGTIAEFLKAASTSDDRLLAELASSLLNRRLYKAIDLSEAPPAALGAFVSAVVMALPSDRPGDYLFAVDSPSDVPYKPYDPGSPEPAMQIYVEDSFGTVKEVSLCSPTVRELRNRSGFTRYYYPPDLAPLVAKIATKKLPRGKK